MRAGAGEMDGLINRHLRPRLMPATLVPASANTRAAGPSAGGERAVACTASSLTVRRRQPHFPEGSQRMPRLGLDVSDAQYEAWLDGSSKAGLDVKTWLAKLADAAVKPKSRRKKPTPKK